MNKVFLVLILACSCFGDDLPDIRTVEADLSIPKVSDQSPRPGQRVKLQLDAYIGTSVFHLLYLPTDWQKGKKYPMIVEYAGNGPYNNKFGDLSTGKVDGSQLGYGISGGKGFIWLCLPYVSKDHKKNQNQWWGDRDATIGYCKKAVAKVSQEFGADPKKLILTGFSRGAIACNYIGLADDDIASLWKGFIAYSHYDGVRNWAYKGADRQSAARRLARLKDKAQFIIMENNGNKESKAYLKKTYPKGKFTFVDLNYRNHNASWVLRPTKERQAVRKWLTDLLK